MSTDKTMTCRRFSELLDELLAGTLSDASRRSMEEHAAACDSCATTLRDARRALDAGRSRTPSGRAKVTCGVTASSPPASARRVAARASLPAAGACPGGREVPARVAPTRVCVSPSRGPAPAG